MRQARVAVAFGLFILVGLNLGGSGVLLKYQIDDYGIDKTTMGVVFFASSIGYLASASANGTLLHRLGLRTYLGGGAAVMAAASAAIALRPPTFALYVVLQIVLGFGIGAIEAALNAYLSTLDRATTLLNSLHAFFGVGALAGPLVAAAMMSGGYRWTAFFALMAVLVVPFLAGLLAFYPRAAAAVGPADERPRFTHALRLPGVWLSGLFLALYVGVEISVGSWSFSFLTEDRGQGAVLAGWAVSGYWIGLTTGRFVLSRLADRVGLGVVGLIGACLAGLLASALGIWLVPGTAVAGLALLGFCLGPMYPTMIAVVPRLVPAGLVATGIGIVIGVSVAGGAFLPWLAGSVVQRIGAWSLYPYSAGLAALVALVWWLIARRLAPAPAPTEEAVPALAP